MHLLTVHIPKPSESIPFQTVCIFRLPEALLDWKNNENITAVSRPAYQRLAMRKHPIIRQHKNKP